MITLPTQVDAPDDASDLVADTHVQESELDTCDALSVVMVRVDSTPSIWLFR